MKMASYAAATHKHGIYNLQLLLKLPEYSNIGPVVFSLGENML